jgi:hypothetical protein
MTEEVPKAGFAENFATKYQYLMDKSSPLVLYRWIGMAVSMALYMARVYYINGFFIVTYGLGIYLLNQLIGFISPQVRLFLCTGDVRDAHLHWRCQGCSFSSLP